MLTTGLVPSRKAAHRVVVGQEVGATVSFRTQLSQPIPAVLLMARARSTLANPRG